MIVQTYFQKIHTSNIDTIESDFSDQDKNGGSATLTTTLPPVARVGPVKTGHTHRWQGFQKFKKHEGLILIGQPAGILKTVNKMIC